MMSSVAELEQQILALSTREFLHVRDVVYEREQALLNDDGAQDDPVLEAELLKGLEGPWMPMDDEYFQRLRKTLAKAT